MKHLAFAILALGGCHCAAPATETQVPKNALKLCKTACGLHMQVDTTAECAELQEAEGRIFLAYKHHVKSFHVEGACTTLDGWTVLRHDPWNIGNCTDAAWEETKGFCVGGVTRSKLRVMDIAGTLQGGSLAHEFGHVVLGLGHCDWDSRGVLAAIKEATGAEDETKPECGEE